MSNVTSQDFGAFFQCYKSPMATYQCLNSFRRHYPNSTIVLVSDNGYNYTKMAEYFKCIYIHCNENAHLITKIEGDYIKKVHALLKRIKNAFLLINEEYVMWLEDDVSINDKITDTFRYDINGFCPNEYGIVDALKKTYPFLKKECIYRWSGHGGSIFHKGNLLSCLDNTPILDNVLINWKEYELASNISQDYLLSLLMILNQFTIGPYEGHADGTHGLNHYIKIQHQYKELYNTPLPPELVHLVDESP